MANQEPLTMRTLTRLGQIVVGILLLVSFACSSEFRDFKTAEAVITPQAIKKHDSILASDAFMGRMPFTEGETKTINYLKNIFQQIGLKPGNKESYFQEVPMVEVTGTPSQEMIIHGGKGDLALQFEDEFTAISRRIEPRISVIRSPLVFAGYGIVAPEYNWNDYEDLDVKGKTVIVLVNDPGYATGDSALFKGKKMTYYGRWTYKYEEAARQGATGVLVIHETGAAGYPWGVLRNSAEKPTLMLRPKDKNKSRCAFEGWLTEAAAEKLFSGLGMDYESLTRKAAQQGFRPVEMPGSVSLEISNSMRYNVSHNVLGLLPGTGRADECIIYTAHWDHFGIGKKINGDSIYNGAADNGYPLACLLETARAFTKLQTRPLRSVLFVAVTAEEEGLIGSEYYVTHPVFPLNKTVANINYELFIPMGEMKDVTITGYGQSQLDDYVKDAAQRQGRYVVEEPHPENGMYFRSDHFSFARYGVPSLFCKGWTESALHGREWAQEKVNDYWTNHYHQPSDEYHSGDDASGIAMDGRLFFYIGYKLSNEAVFPEWNKGSEFKAIRDRMMSGTGQAK